MKEPHGELLIDGVAPDPGPGFDVVNPADPSELVGRCAVATPEQVEAAVEAADRASETWAAMSVDERASVLASFAAVLEDDVDESARLLCREHGKTLAEARAEILGAAQIVRWHAEQGDVLAPREACDHRGRVVRRRVPFGVVAVIVPWNYPLLLAQLMIAPALLAGNAVVVKLPDHAPLLLSRQLHELASLLPAGVLNVLAGDGSTVGATLAGHRLVRKVAFTGSTATGRSIMNGASSTLKSLSLELGGNDAAIVLPDTTFTGQLFAELVLGALTNAGQVCYAPKRFYVHRPRLGEFVEGLTAAAESVVVGDGRNPRVTMGPLNNAEQLRRIQELLDDAVENGASIMPLGRVGEDLPEDGFFFQPRLVTAPSNDVRVVQEEQFGPLIPVVAYDTVADAVRYANDSEYGLAASVWGDEAETAFAIAAQIEAGTVFVNIHRVGASSVDMPFGGVKQSGLGRGHAVEGIYEYTELQILAQREDMKQSTRSVRR